MSRILRAGVLLSALVGLGGCMGHFQPATGILVGVRQPIMVSVTDRIGGGQALPTQVVGEYEAEARALFSRHESGDYVITTEMTDNTPVAVEAVKSLAGKGDADIRLTTLRARSFGWPAGLSNRVYVEGDVVVVGGAK